MKKEQIVKLLRLLQLHFIMRPVLFVKSSVLPVNLLSCILYTVCTKCKLFSCHISQVVSDNMFESCICLSNYLFWQHFPLLSVSDALYRQIVALLIETVLTMFNVEVNT